MHRLSAADIEHLTAQLDFYADLVATEFAERDLAEIYRLAFSRLTRPSPIDAVRHPERPPAMLGADERELLLPVLRDTFGAAPDGARVLDLGAGDGQTVALALQAVPERASFTIEDPNRAYLDSYAAVVASREDLALVAAHAIGVDAFLDELMRRDDAPQYEVVLAIHMLYFAANPVEALGRMIDRLAPGGRLMMVVADGVSGFTSKSVCGYLERIDLRRAASWREKEVRLLGALGDPVLGGRPSDATEALTRATGRKGIRALVQLQPSRLYGVDLGDVIALGFITGLAEQDDAPTDQKIESMLSLLRDRASTVDLALHLDGDHRGWFSVSEPQVVLEVSKI